MADVDEALEHISQCKYLSEKNVLQFCKRATGLFQKETNVVKVPIPVTIVGDIHGQFYHLYNVQCTYTYETAVLRAWLFLFSSRLTQQPKLVPVP
jgi:hypothetical protein